MSGAVGGGGDNSGRAGELLDSVTPTGNKLGTANWKCQLIELFVEHSSARGWARGRWCSSRSEEGSRWRFGREPPCTPQLPHWDLV